MFNVLAENVLTLSPDEFVAPSAENMLTLSPDEFVAPSAENTRIENQSAIRSEKESELRFDPTPESPERGYHCRLDPQSPESSISPISPISPKSPNTTFPESKVKILYHKGRKGNSQKSQRFEYQYFQFSVLCASFVSFVVKLIFNSVSFFAHIAKKARLFKHNTPTYQTKQPDHIDKTARLYRQNSPTA